ncbi:hypothetical protein BCR44DRAFT_350576 [Catenaria anguillulae PL171]|uniref:Uncharacterized protein n=1 Tax=Catenaria anguillulae PL171 TaxID=765915 RepID=A0A1Y2HWY1_9FUNG|nr:hypothetical protein BCR44DRAFT_350576 [Catenaria anguillulae PL171]
MNSPALESTHYPEQLLPATFSVRPLACSQTADTSQPHLVFPLSQPCPCWLWILRSHFEKPRGRSCQARRKVSFVCPSHPGIFSAFWLKWRLCLLISPPHLMLDEHRLHTLKALTCPVVVVGSSCGDLPLYEPQLKSPTAKAKCKDEYTNTTNVRLN